MDEKIDREITSSKAVCHKSEDADAENNNKHNNCENTDITSCTTITTTNANAEVLESTPSSAKNLHANLWNTFLKSISQKRETGCKYPNPNVPEFFPRNATSYFGAYANSSDQKKTTTATETSSTTKCIVYNKNNIVPKNDLVLMSQQCFAAARTADVNLKTIVDPSNDLVNGITRYYWTFNNPSCHRMPRVITYRSDQVQIETPSVDRAVKSASNNFQTELGKKDKQLVHLNNVVKALLEEIWRVNELLTKQKNKEQLNNDITFAIDQLLKPSSELGFHCDDCCDKFKRFVIKIFKQQERKIAKQQAHYKDKFIDYLVSIIENSLEAFNKCGHVKYNFKATLMKHDAATQTDPTVQDDQRKPYRRPDTRKSKQQMTKIYRNRNFYKVYDVQSNAGLNSTNWYPASMSSTSFISHQNQNDKNRNKLVRNNQPNLYSYSYSSQMYKTASSSTNAQQPPFYESQITNPIQLIHQKYKNLNCRLEGLPDKNLVKFSYIVNGKEYSAIASTKKEAQYHCAWHVLGATKHK